LVVSTRSSLRTDLGFAYFATGSGDIQGFVSNQCVVDCVKRVSKLCLRSQSKWRPFEKPIYSPDDLCRRRRPDSFIKKPMTEPFTQRFHRPAQKGTSTAFRNTGARLYRRNFAVSFGWLLFGLAPGGKRQWLWLATPNFCAVVVGVHLLRCLPPLATAAEGPSRSALSDVN